MDSRAAPMPPANAQILRRRKLRPRMQDALCPTGVLRRPLQKPNTVKMLPHDRPRARRITSRIVFWICGLTSLLIAYLYVSQQGEDLPVESEWIIFAVALGIVGVGSVLAGTIPRSWMARVCKSDREDPRLFSGPLKLLGVFAAIGYLVACFEYFAPHTWRLNPQVMLAFCPMYVVKMIIDPSPVWIFLVLAPMNAAVGGALGLTLGYVWSALRRSAAA